MPEERRVKSRFIQEEESTNITENDSNDTHWKQTPEIWGLEFNRSKFRYDESIKFPPHEE
jgi:hypothetical protein